MKKNSKKVIKAVDRIGRYCDERVCDNCMFCHDDRCLLDLRGADGYYELAEDLKKLLEG